MENINYQSLTELLKGVDLEIKQKEKSPGLFEVVDKGQKKSVFTKMGAIWGGLICQDETDIDEVAKTIFNDLISKEIIIGTSVAFDESLTFVNGSFLRTELSEERKYLCNSDY